MCVNDAVEDENYLMDIERKSIREKEKGDEEEFLRNRMVKFKTR